MDKIKIEKRSIMMEEVRSTHLEKMIRDGLTHK